MTGADDHTVGYARIRAGSCEQLHRHPHGSEWAYVVSGSYRLLLDGEELEMKPGSSVYIPRDAVHGYVLGDEDVEILWGYSAPTYEELGRIAAE